MVQINPYAALSNVGQSANDKASIADNFDTFLSLLTTQLKNQNPLDPLDMNQFTQQLVQFAQVEQSVKTNTNLEQIAKLAAANTITNVVGYIGKEVTVSGAKAELKNGSAAWSYTISGDSPGAVFTVSNSAGTPVFTQTLPVSAGSNGIAWDGRTDTGGIAPDGTYTLSIVARDASGKTLSTNMSANGIVDGVDMSGNEPVLLIGGQKIKLDAVTAIRTP